ncbi:glycosyltransferase, partial [Aquabacterium sp.]|uniref:glycosyltransferase n=1 Tax=Aquabacterium sp. TaxID=1872578 RepID=UPI0025BB5FC4
MPHPAPILIDGVFFQIGRSGIAKVWTQVFQQWLASGFAQHVRVIDRQHTLPRLPGLEVIDAPGFSYHDLESDRDLLQRLCDQHGAQVFASTYYSHPRHTPTLLLVHDMIPEVLGWDLSEPMWRQKQSALAHASAFATVSQHTARDLRQHLAQALGRPEVPITLAPNGCDLQPARAEAVTDFRLRHGLHQPYFMLSGTRDDYKNADLFFEAFALLGEARAGFHILCTGGGELKPTQRAQAGPATVHVAILTEADMALAYSGAIALVYPSLYEGFGLPVLEAMACACPVVCTDAASLP